jgi:hypothetical protein
MDHLAWKCINCTVDEFTVENEAIQHAIETGHSIQPLVFSVHKSNRDPRWIPVEGSE